MNWTPRQWTTCKSRVRRERSRTRARRRSNPQRGDAEEAQRRHVRLWCVLRAISASPRLRVEAYSRYERPSHRPLRAHHGRRLLRGRQDRRARHLRTRHPPPAPAPQFRAGRRPPASRSTTFSTSRFTADEIAYLRGLPAVPPRLARPSSITCATSASPATSSPSPKARRCSPASPCSPCAPPSSKRRSPKPTCSPRVTFQTLIATKAARCAEAAAGRAVVEFGTRRAHTPEAGVLGARAAYIGGCAGTSNTLAGFRYGIPVMGTAAHSWVMSFCRRDWKPSASSSACWASPPCSSSTPTTPSKGARRAAQTRQARSGACASIAAISWRSPARSAPSSTKPACRRQDHGQRRPGRVPHPRPGRRRRAHRRLRRRHAARHFRRRARRWAPSTSWWSSKSAASSASPPNSATISRPIPAPSRSSATRRAT